MQIIDVVIAVLSIVGSVASVVGAIWAYQQARRSLKYANEARQLRDEMVDRRQMIEISRVHAETSRVLNMVAKVGPTCTPTSIKGLNWQEIAREVEDYSRLLNEHRNHFGLAFTNRAEQLCTSLRPLIERLSEATEFEAVKNAGKSIYYEVSDFMPVAKELTDRRREAPSRSTGRNR